MQECDNWNDNVNEIFELFSALENDKNVNVPLECPICKQSSAHIYMYRWEENKGTKWVWCSKCSACSHGSFMLPEWWENDDFIDTSELTSHPIYLENKVKLIDNHLRTLLERRNAQK